MERLEEHLYPKLKEMCQDSEKTTKCSARARRYRSGIDDTTISMFLEQMLGSVVSIDRLK